MAKITEMASPSDWNAQHDSLKHKVNGHLSHMDMGDPGNTFEHDVLSRPNGSARITHEPLRAIDAHEFHDHMRKHGFEDTNSNPFQGTVYGKKVSDHTGDHTILTHVHYRTGEDRDVATSGAVVGSATTGIGRNENMARKNLKEETEINELSHKKLGQYINKAHGDAVSAADDAGEDRGMIGGDWGNMDDDNDSDVELHQRAGENYSRIDKRNKGIHMAVSKLTGAAKQGPGLSAKDQFNRGSYKEETVKEDTLQNIISDAIDGNVAGMAPTVADILHQKIGAIIDSMKPEVAASMFEQAPEEVDEETLDELSKKTLGSYINKAADSAAMNHAKRMLARKKDERMSDFLNTNDIDSESKRQIRKVTDDKFRDEENSGYRKSYHRIRGIEQAVDRLTKG